MWRPVLYTIFQMWPNVYTAAVTFDLLTFTLNALIDEGKHVQPLFTILSACVPLTGSYGLAPQDLFVHQCSKGACHLLYTFHLSLISQNVSARTCLDSTLSAISPPNFPTNLHILLYHLLIFITIHNSANFTVIHKLTNQIF